LSNLVKRESFALCGEPVLELANIHDKPHFAPITGKGGHARQR